MRLRRLATVGWITAVAACGDNIPGDGVLASVSGGRLALQVYGYDDGTRQVDPVELYDLHLHTKCTAQLWADGWTRCVPEADDAVFVDAACTMVVGRGFAPEKPTVFIGYDVVDSQTVPARLYRAGMATAPAIEFYEKVDGACIGPFVGPSDITYYSVTDEVPATDIVPIYDDERGDGRIGVQLRISDDGVRQVTGLRDHALDAACTPARIDGGAIVCVPQDPAPAPATLFHDPACAEPVVAVFDVIPPQPVPAIAAVSEPSGCTSYRAVGAEVTAPVYRRAGDACVPASVVSNQRLYSAAAPIDVAVLDRTVEAAPDRRLQRIVLGDGVSRFLDSRLFDTATRADCARVAVGDGYRCLPTPLVGAITLYAPGCGVPVPVVELPAQACEPARFAVASGLAGLEVRAIGDPVASPLYWTGTGVCAPYAPATGSVIHALGPPIDPTAFVGATYYGER
jgi:hypothetical protein